MIDEAILARVFRAAADGAMAPYNFRLTHGFTGAVSQPMDLASYNAAKSLAGSFSAIADVFEKLSAAAHEPATSIPLSATPQAPHVAGE